MSDQIHDTQTLEEDTQYDTSVTDTVIAETPVEVPDVEPEVVPDTVITETPVEIPVVDVPDVTPDAEPEVIPEPIVPDTVIAETPVEVPADVISVNDVSSLIISTNDLHSTLTNIATKCDNLGVRSVASTLLDYQDKTGLGNPALPVTILVGKHYSVHNVIMQVLKETNQSLFRIKFDMINKVFADPKFTAFSDLMMNRHPDAWQYGDKQHTAYRNLIAAITILSNRSTRKTNLIKINLDAVTDIESTGITADMSNNFKSYYAE